MTEFFTTNVTYNVTDKDKEINNHPLKWAVCLTHSQ